MQQVAIVSGGAGGIGRVVSARLAELGYNVVIADASEENAREIIAELRCQEGQQHIAVTGDLTLEETNSEVVRQAAELGAITAVVNAVGVSPKRNGVKINFFDIEPELWDSVMAINVKAPFLLIKEVYAHMPTDGSASIVNLHSITSRMAAGGLDTDIFPPFLPSAAVYAASKAAMQNLTATLSRELSSFNIRVNGVAPGLVDTSMTGAVPDKNGMSRQIPMNRFGRPNEVADSIEFLLSDKASYITGASLEINGGWQTC